jgi:hypothetical protein
MKYIGNLSCIWFILFTALTKDQYVCEVAV